MTGNYLDLFLFVALPYVAMVLFFLGTIQRYRSQMFTYSSLSSQFLENQHHFWGLVPFHYGIMVLFFGHLTAFAVPRGVLWWNSQPLRLYILESSALAFGLLTLIGLLAAIWRRLRDARIQAVSTPVDWVLHVLLLIQVLAGLYTAVFHGWGSSWFAAVLSPYLWSLFRLSPSLNYVAPLPWAVKLHIAGAFAIFAVFPFTRLVHLLVFPTPYLWRKPQMVRWYSRPGGRA